MAETIVVSEWSEELDVAWAAGFFDGEGHVSCGLNKQNHGLFTVMIVVNTDRRPLVELQRAFGGSLNSLKARGAGHKVQWRWDISGHDAEAFAEAILPYLRVKREQVEVLLALRETVVPGRKLRRVSFPEVWQLRDDLIGRLRTLNRRGVST